MGIKREPQRKLDKRRGAGNKKPVPRCKASRHGKKRDGRKRSGFDELRAGGEPTENRRRIRVGARNRPVAMRKRGKLRSGGRRPDRKTHNEDERARQGGGL